MPGGVYGPGLGLLTGGPGWTFDWGDGPDADSRARR